MSDVTSVIILTELHWDYEDIKNDHPISLIQDWLTANEYGALKRVDEHAGGNRALQDEVWLGAFNYLELEEFIEFVKGLDWTVYQESVEFLYKDEHDEEFTYLRLKEADLE